ncbi:MAG: GSCFA domain-containing protein, partial [Melioribacteraceae bacterium]|nr:GSCFA domain-containing protein [Melioribacteraceae bacterium]
LRDYRFFASDLLHPSEQAVNYIWEKFSTTYFSDDCFRVMNEIKKIVEARNHKPRNKESNLFLQFKKKYYDLSSQLLLKYQYLDLEDEIKYFKE